MNANRILEVFAGLLLTITAIFLLYTTSSMMPPIVTGLLSAYILFPVVRKADTLGIPRGVAILGLIVVLSATGVFAVYSFLPTVKKEVLAVAHAGNASAETRQSKLLSVVNKVSITLHNLGAINAPVSEPEAAEWLSTFVDEKSSVLVRELGGWAGRTGQFFMISAFVFVFGLLDGEKFYRAIISLIPNSFFEPGIFIFHKSSEMMGYYIRGLVVENLVLGAIAMVMLFVLALISPLTIPMALAIAAIIALTNVIRIVGPVFGGAVGVVLALASTADLYTAGGVAIVAVIVQLADNIIVLPLVMRDQVDIHPIICLLGVLAGGLVGGILGMVLAIPVIGGIKVVHRVLTVEMKQVTDSMPG